MDLGESGESGESPVRGGEAPDRRAEVYFGTKLIKALRTRPAHTGAHGDAVVARMPRQCWTCRCGCQTEGFRMMLAGCGYGPGSWPNWSLVIFNMYFLSITPHTNVPVFRR